MKILTLKEIYLYEQDDQEYDTNDPEDVFNVLDEFFGGYEYFTTEQANKIITAAKNHGAKIDITTPNTKKKLAVVEYKNKKYVIEPDDDGMVNVFSPEDWIQSVMWDERADEYLGENNYSENFWTYPGLLYHATPEENVEEILENGIEAKSETRGLSNRNMSDAVFTSTNPDGYIESYGDAVFEINTSQMKADGYTPEVSQEEDIERYEQESSLINLLGLDMDIYPEEPEQGLSYETVAIFGNIPPKYLRLLKQQ